MLNVGLPEKAFSYAHMPCAGVGLARLEFIINSYIGIHPLALLDYRSLKARAKNEPEIGRIVRKIDRITSGVTDKPRFFVDALARGVGRIAAAFYPKDVIVRLSDFKTNEYANLVGGHLYEPAESNPMIGWRGASRYYSGKFRPAFELECKALLKARRVIGLNNIKIMIPFCRTLEEGRKVIELMREFGLVQGEDGLEIYMMVEIPSNVMLADEFAELFDGFSIGSNDLTQLTLGLDRDSELVSHIYSERNEAVKRMIRHVIEVGRERNVKVGICGQAPSDFPDFACFLVDCGIDSISLNPDTVIKTTMEISETERRLRD
jgi:pyruvate,water dikinase